MLLTPRHKPKPILGDGTLVDYMEDGKKFEMVHMEHVDPLLKQNRESRKNDPKSMGRAKWRKIGSIPALLFAQHPEWFRDPKSLEKFLASSDGEVYRTVKKI